LFEECVFSFSQNSGELLKQIGVECGTPASWSAETESAKSALWLGQRTEHPNPKGVEGTLESGDSEDSVAALQNLAAVPGVPLLAPASCSAVAAGVETKQAP
jgi:hypothetical protein